jgi:HlyD family secretion protein
MNKTRGLCGSRTFLLALATIAAGACRSEAPADRVRVSGQVEATEVQVAPQVAGRILELSVAEGDQVTAGAVVARLDTADAELGLARARADREQADAQLRLLRAGARSEDVRQAEAQVAAAQADAAASEAEVAAAQVDVDRFERLLASNSGTGKQRDDAVARRDVARERTGAARDRVRAARETVARLHAGARPEEIDAARARVAAADAQIATWQKAIGDGTVMAPIAGVVTQKLADAGELVQPRAPIVAITDAGGQVPGTISNISTRAEFTPRNVQTAEDRSKLVYRVKVSVDNREGVLKVGMPVEAEIQFVQ